VGDAPLGQGIQQGPRDMFLPDHPGEKLGTPLAIEYLGRHYSLYYTLKQG
jgi:hypothetical protein